MKTIQLGGAPEFAASAVAMGAFRIGEMDALAVEQWIETGLACGINFFDHADIYGGGAAEDVFGQVLAKKPSLRGQMKIQSKCGIRKGFFDFSKEHIIRSAENSLRRLNTDHLDLLLLHRPDTLVEPEEVAEAFDILAQSGKVLGFGVSNQSPAMVKLLKKTVTQPLLVNQLQFGLKHSLMIDQGIHFNMTDSEALDRTGGVLEYARLHDMTIQAWSPMMFGFFEGVFLDHPDHGELNQMMEGMASEKNTTKNALAVAWILRHPAKIQVILGTTNTQRVKDYAAGAEIDLTREEWYRLYTAAGNILP